MLIGRLCKSFKIFDVESFIRELDHDNWNVKFWEAFDKIEPFGQEWRQTAEILAALSLLTSVQSVTGGLEEMEPRTWEETMPPRWIRPAKKERSSNVPGIEYANVKGELLAGLGL